MPPPARPKPLKRSRRHRRNSREGPDHRAAAGKVRSLLRNSPWVSLGRRCATSSAMLIGILLEHGRAMASGLTMSKARTDTLAGRLNRWIFARRPAGLVYGPRIYPRAGRHFRLVSVSRLRPRPWSHGIKPIASSRLCDDENPRSEFPRSLPPVCRLNGRGPAPKPVPRPIARRQLPTRASPSSALARRRAGWRRWRNSSVTCRRTAGWRSWW